MEINKDKVNFILMLAITLVDIMYMFIYSISMLLNIVILLWVFVMVPNILVYARGNGKWKSARCNGKVTK